MGARGNKHVFPRSKVAPNHALRPGKEGTGFGEPPPSLPSLVTLSLPAEPIGKGKDLELSDLEDFDPLEGEPPECELKPPFQPLDGGLDRIPTGPEGPSAPGKEAPGALRLPLAAGGGAALDQDLERARSCLRSAAAVPEQPAGAGAGGGPQVCESKLGFAPSGASAGLEAKPRIWSLENRKGGKERGNQERGRRLKKKEDQKRRRKMREDNSRPDKGLLQLGI